MPKRKDIATVGDLIAALRDMQERYDRVKRKLRRAQRAAASRTVTVSILLENDGECEVWQEIEVPESRAYAVMRGACFGMMTRGDA